MSRRIIDYDSTIARHVSLLCIRAARRADCWLSELFDRGKRPGVAHARQFVWHQLRETLQCAAVGPRGKLVFRIVEGEAVVYQQPGAPPNAIWDPVSGPVLAFLLGKDHTTVLLSLRRAKKGSTTENTEDTENAELAEAIG